MSSDINKVIELQVASEVRYQSIVRRAFAKRPPFEGKDKKSDKGFKDALLWESILEFMAGHDSAKIIFYSKDNIFGNELESEFSDIFPNAELTICTTEEAIRQCLDRWAKEIDIYAYNPIESDSEHENLINWFQSSDFEDQAIAHSDGLIEKSVLEELELPVPDLDEQKRIGTFLARLDEKIVLNNRINDNLAA